MVHGEDGAQRGHAVCGLEGCPGAAAASPSGKEPRGGMKEAPRIFFCRSLLWPWCPSADKQWQGLGMPFKD